MKRFLFIILSLGILTSFSLAQLAVRTEAASNKVRFNAAAQTADTLFTHAVLGDSSSGYHGVIGYLVGVLVGSPVASDTLIFKRGHDAIAQIILPSSGNAPAYYPIGAKVDTALIYVQKKTSAVSVIYRIGY